MLVIIKTRNVNLKYLSPIHKSNNQNVLKHMETLVFDIFQIMLVCDFAKYFKRNFKLIRSAYILK